MKLIGFVRQVISAFGQDKAGQMSSAFAYVGVFSIGPLLLIVVSIVSFVYGQQAANGQLYDQLSGAFGPETAKTLQSVIAHSHHAGAGVTALIFGVIGLILGAVALTSQLQNSFNAILRVASDPDGGIKATIYVKIKNLIIIILAALVAVASMAISVIVNSVGSALGLEFLNTLISLILFIFVLYLIYRFLPDVIIPRNIALIAAAGISLMFLIGKIILGIVIGRNSTASAYGAAAAVIVLMLWFYYIAQILMLGAEGIKVYGLAHNIEFEAKRHALKRKSVNINVKRDLRGRLLESFSRGYRIKRTSSKR